MSDTKPSERKPQKMIKRTVAISLGIICIILVAGLGGVATFYASVIRDRDSTIASKDNQIASLNSQIASLNASLNSQMSEENNTISSLNYQISRMNSTLWDFQDQIASLETTNNSLTSKLTDLQKIANMQDSTILYNKSIPLIPIPISESSYYILFDSLPDFFLEAQPVRTDYAGYIIVSVTNSTSNSTYVEMNYSFNGFSYDKAVSVGSSGSTMFFILPSTGTLNILVANADTSVDIHIANVTVTYYY